MKRNKEKEREPDYTSIIKHRVTGHVARFEAYRQDDGTYRGTTTPLGHP